jgi:Fur family peroxide stress response transcriptional regulator
MDNKNSAPKKHLKEFEKICRGSGLKLTHQRIEILRVLASSSEHPSAERIHNILIAKFPTISLDTVYRTLFTFEKLGIISRVHILDDRSRFDANLTPHHHMVCTKCKSIMDFYWPTFDEIELPHDTKKWGRIKSRQVEVRGMCDSCMAPNSKNK